MNNSTQTPSYRLILKQFFIQSVLFVGLFVILFSFQNCSSEIASDNSDLSSLGSTLPFAYDSKIDHLAYMSCSEMAPGTYDTNAFFTFKAGAYETTGGLSFSDGFRAKAGQLTPALMAETLALSPLNAGVLQQIAIRDNTNYQQYFTVPNSLNFSNFVTSLSDVKVAGVLGALGPGARANNFPALPANIQKYEGRLFFSSSEIYAQQVRSALQAGQGVVGLTFNQPAVSAANAIGETAGSTSSVYGTGLSVQFRLPTGYSSGNARTLSTVTEKNLANGAAGGGWNCSANYVFRVVRFADLGVRITCPNLAMVGEPNLAGASAAQLDTYNVMRRALPSQYWALDIVNKCAVLRSGVTGQCYGNDPANAINVQYAAGSSCSGNTCPHFVSVCKKL
jgi:hypothetical protein